MLQWRNEDHKTTISRKRVFFHTWKNRMQVAASSKLLCALGPVPAAMKAPQRHQKSSREFRKLRHPLNHTPDLFFGGGALCRPWGNQECWWEGGTALVTPPPPRFFGEDSFCDSLKGALLSGEAERESPSLPGFIGRIPSETS